MKKSIIIAATAAIFISCNQPAQQAPKDNSAAIDSLESIIEQKDNEIDDLMGTFNDIQDGFDIINEAEGRISKMQNNAESSNAKENIRENMEFIQQTLKENRQKIAELEDKLSKSSISAAKLKEAIAKLEDQMNEKVKKINELSEELADKDIQIAKLDEAVTVLKEENEEVKVQKEHA